MAHSLCPVAAAVASGHPSFSRPQRRKHSHRGICGHFIDGPLRHNSALGTCSCRFARDPGVHWTDEGSEVHGGSGTGLPCPVVVAAWGCSAHTSPLLFLLPWRVWAHSPPVLASLPASAQRPRPAPPATHSRVVLGPRGCHSQTQRESFLGETQGRITPGVSWP